MMKRIFLFLFVLLLSAGLVSCTVNVTEQESTEENNASAETPGTPSDSSLSPKEEEEKTPSPDTQQPPEQQEEPKSEETGEDEQEDEKKPSSDKKPQEGNQKPSQGKEEEGEDSPSTETPGGSSANTTTPPASSATQTPPASSSTPNTSSTQTTPETHTHVWKMTSSTKATCTKDGVTIYVCSCSAKKTETQGKLGHSMGSWKTVREATTAKEGQKERSCSRCSHKETASIPKVSVSVPADCREVLNLVNAERKKKGLAPLSYYSAGQAAANLRAEECKTLFDHTRPDGRDCFSVFDDLGLSDFMCGENLASGQKSAAEVVGDWMNSEGHRANILRAETNALVVAHVGSCWVQIFVIV